MSPVQNIPHYLAWWNGWWNGCSAFKRTDPYGRQDLLARLRWMMGQRVRVSRPDGTYKSLTWRRVRGVDLAEPHRTRYWAALYLNN